MRLREAILALSAEELSIEGLAAQLGVHASTVYQHVRGQEELERRAAELVSAECVSPTDRGQHWSLWCAEYVHALHDMLMKRPELLGLFRSSLPGTIERVEAFLAVFARSGFSLDESELALRTVSNWLYGWIVLRNEMNAGHESNATFRDLVVQRRGPEFALSRELVDLNRSDRIWRPLEDELWVVLAGIAARHGEVLAESYSDALAASEQSDG